MTLLYVLTTRSPLRHREHDPAASILRSRLAFMVASSYHEVGCPEPFQGRQPTQTHQAEIERRRQQGPRQRPQSESDDREQHKGGGKKDQVQLPMQRTRDNRRARQSCALKKEQEANSSCGQTTE